MSKPELQNDYSFYKRSVGSDKVKGLVFPVSPDRSGLISSWLAYSLPMLNVLKSKNMNPGASKVVANLCNALCGMILRHTTESEGMESNDVAKCMIALLILYDKTSATGAFISSSPLKVFVYDAMLRIACLNNLYQMRKILQALKVGGSPDDMSSHINNIKYSTEHYNDDTTPSYIKYALENNLSSI